MLSRSLFVLLLTQITLHAEPVSLTLPHKQASAFVKVALKGIQREFPYKPGHVINNKEDVKLPRELHPAFYGCYDWHSAVHSHWMLIRVLNRFPELPEAKQIRAALARHLTAKNLQKEADYFKQKNRKSFERTYGWAWLLKLAEELHRWQDPDAKKWAKNLEPLTDVIVQGYLNFLPKQTYPIRTGVHPNTAFGIAFALDYARTVGDAKLAALLVRRAKDYFLKDSDAPAKWEPSGADFFSPALMEADLMRRVLTRERFAKWLTGFLPGLAKGKPATLLKPATVTDRSDPQLVHLDGLNLSRAWCLEGIFAALPKGDPRQIHLFKASRLHAQSALKHVTSGEYVGEHWLASFAVYLLT